MKAYLAGAIRSLEDYRWRKNVAERYEGRLTCLVPSDINVKKLENLRKFKPSALMTYRTDLALIDEADFIIVNLNSLAEGYPTIGTLIELGYTIGKGKPVLAVCGSEHKRHPFIAFGTMGAFDHFGDLYSYLDAYLEVTSGKCPMFKQL